MLKFKHTYILLIILLSLVACKQTKYVPEGEYLLKKNEINISGGKLDKEDVNFIIRQQPNYKRFFVKWKLLAFNSVDSVKVADKRKRKNIELRETNRDKLIKQKAINDKRIRKAKEKGRTYYTHKNVILKDTIEPKRFLREWYKYKIGEPPVVFDSLLYNKSLEQLEKFLKNKGYYYGKVGGLVVYKKNGKCNVTYNLETGPRYYIDSTYIVCANPEVKEAYDVYAQIQNDPPLIGKAFDTDLLSSFRYKVAKFMRDSSFYGYSANHITFEADTSLSDMTVKIGIVLGDRIMRSEENRDSVYTIRHQKTFVDEVHFHVADTLSYEGNFKAYWKSKGLGAHEGPFLRTLDSMVYRRVKFRGMDVYDPSRSIVLHYNTEPFVKPSVLEMQNYLESGKQYKEKYTEASYSNLLRLDLFRAIKTELIELPDTNLIEVHYYVAPRKRQSYSFQPKATNSNGYLGVSASINYMNRNLFRGAEQLTFSISGGFESQPPVFETNIEGNKVKTTERTFNTFEIGPSIKLQLPGLFPFRMSRLSKRRRPQTIISTAYNYQNRTDFDRGTFQLNYQWKFIITKTSLFEVGFPLASVVKFVDITKTDAFTEKLNDLGDLFLLNAYSDQFVWQDWKLRYEFNIKEKPNRRGNSMVYFNTAVDPAGNMLSLFSRYQYTLDNGQKGIAGVGYSQFIRMDNELLFKKPLGKERSINFKLQLGGGLPYGNTTTSMPYDYSFFGGGANDNRGWKARTLGPGGYKYYLDTLRSSTQIGDFRLLGSAEYRFAINSFFKGAFFVDAGNIWTRHYDPNRPGGQLTSDWWHQIAIAGGIGLRMDLEYFIIRVDLGMPVRNPALPDGETWIFQGKEDFIQEGKDTFGDQDYEKYLPSPYIPSLHFGIGYPF